MKTILNLGLALLIFQFSKAQIGGNELYNQQHSNYTNIAAQGGYGVTLNENSMSFKVNVLKNVKADAYVVTLGLNEESETVKTANHQINERIKKFLIAIEDLGVKKEDTYIDFISQTKIYDYVTDEKYRKTEIEQVEKGFELKKNIIIKLDDIQVFDALVEVASAYKIHNIISVNYHHSESEKAYHEMFKEAKTIIEKRKKLFDVDDKKWKETPSISISFQQIQPVDQYQSFEAFETSTISQVNYYRNHETILRKEARKAKTFYYKGQKPNLYDKAINASTPVVGLQYVMNVSMVYTKKVEHKREEKEKNQPKTYYFLNQNGDLKQLSLPNS